MRKIALVVIALVIVSASISFYMKSRKDKTEETKTVSQSVAVDVIAPSRSTLHRVVEVYGSLSPKNTTDVKCEVPGRILKMRVKEWDHVKADDVLLEIDPVDFKLELSRNDAGVKMTKAQLLRAKVDLNRARREWSFTDCLPPPRDRKLRHDPCAGKRSFYGRDPIHVGNHLRTA